MHLILTSFPIKIIIGITKTKDNKRRGVRLGSSSKKKKHVMAQWLEHSSFINMTRVIDLAFYGGICSELPSLPREFFFLFSGKPCSLFSPLKPTFPDYVLEPKTQGHRFVSGNINLIDRYYG